jgi:5-formyltetrahydrofolate cyclo-ligase
MNKKELRKLFLEKRKSLTEAECAQFNLQIYAHFFAAIDLSFTRVLHCYLPLAENHEPDTWALLDRIRREFPHIRVSLPRVNGDDLENFYYEGLQQLQTSSWGIQEPKQGVPTPPEKIDLVIVPLLAIDKLGHRVGYGRGYYDRLLTQTRPDCVTVGLSFFPPVDLIEDAGEKDVPLSYCVTPLGIIDFRSNAKV